MRFTVLYARYRTHRATCMYQDPKHAAAKAATRGRKHESHADKAAKEAEDNAKAIADGEKLIHETK